MKTFLRTALGLLIMLAGFSLILGVSLFAMRLALTGYLAAHPNYLVAATQLAPETVAVWVELTPEAAPTQSVERIASALVGNVDGFTDGSLPLRGLPSATPDPARLNPADPGAAPPGSEPHALTAPEAGPTAAPTAAPTNSQPTPTPALNEQPEAGTPAPPPSPTLTAELVAIEQIPTEAPTPLPEPVVFTPPDPIVRLLIPRLKVKRAVVEIGLVPGGNSFDQWDTDSLFATQNRPDLVGHLLGSAFPGEGGNTVLVGHNFDNTGNGVFVNLHKLEVGDEIRIITESGQEYVYQVFKVKIVPYSAGGGAELERHQRFLGLAPDERITLVTCGGVRIGFYNKRVYVVAAPVQP